jgi:hypothetical protein
MILYEDNMLVSSWSVAEHNMHVNVILQAIMVAHFRMSEGKRGFGATERY